MQCGTFLPCNKALARKWNERQLKKHSYRVRHVKSYLDLSPPKRFPHLEMRLKKIQMDEERQTLIDKHNQVLLNKLTNIMSKPGTVDHWNEYPQRRRHSIDVPAFSLNQPSRQRALEKIVEENRRLAFRLENVRPSYRRKEWDKSFKKHLRIRRMLETGDKDFPHSQIATYHDYAQNDGNYSDSWESISDDENDAKKNKSRKNSIQTRSRTPSPADGDLAYRKKTQKPNNEKSNNRNAKVPKLPQIKEKGIVKKDNKKSQTEIDAKQLFRAVKHLTDPEETLLKHLAKRSYSQRMLICDTFEDLYDLELGEELKECLGKKYSALINGLLQEHDSKADENVKDLNTAIEGRNVDDLLRIIVSKDKCELIRLKNEYKREFNRTIEADIGNDVEDDDVKRLVLILLKKEMKSTDPDAVLAENTANELYDENNWTDENGKFLKLLHMRSYGQIVFTFAAYESLYGESVSDAVAEQSSLDYSAAVHSLGKQIKATNHEKALNLFKNVHSPDGGKLFIELLLQAAEGDMPAVKQAYREKYKVELTDSILSTFKSQVGRILIEIAHKSSTTKKTGAKRMGGMTINPVPKRQPLAKPKPQPVIQDKTHPLGQPSKNKSSLQKDMNRLDDTVGENNTAVRKLAEQEKNELGENDEQPDDCKKIYDAMQGLGTDEDAVIEIISNRNREQLLELKKQYEKRYKQDLLEDLESDFSSDFADLSKGLFKTTNENELEAIHFALTPPTDENTILGIICNRPSEEINKLADEYERIQNTDLQTDVNKSTSKLAAEIFEKILQGYPKKENGDVDMAQATSDAQQIYEDLLEENLDKLATLLNTSSLQQIIATEEEYEKITDNSLKNDIEKSLTAADATTYTNICAILKDKTDFVLEQLNNAICLSIDHKQLTNIILLMRDNLQEITRKYERKYSKSLKKSIDEEITGDYGTLVQALIPD